MKDKYFFKLFINNEQLDYLRSDPLLFAVLIECARRARRVKDTSPEGLEQKEFFLSRTEFAKFGLRASQQGLIDRRMKELVKLGYIQDTYKRIGKGIGNERSKVWLFNSNNTIMPLFESDIKIDSGSDVIEAQNNLGASSKVDRKEKREDEKERLCFSSLTPCDDDCILEIAMTRLAYKKDVKAIRIELQEDIKKFPNKYKTFHESLSRRVRYKLVKSYIHFAYADYRVKLDREYRKSNRHK